MRRYHNYHNDWIMEHKDNFFSWAEMCKEYNRIFGTDIERVRFKVHCNKLGLRLDSYKYTNEQKEWLKEHYPVLGAEIITEMFNEKFKQNRSVDAIKQMCFILGLKLAEDVFADYRKRTTENLLNYHKKRTAPVGTICKKTSTTCERVKSENGEWIPIGKYLYEKNIGKVPKGYQVIFLDGNRDNHELINLEIVPVSYQALMNTYNLRSSDREITKTSVKWCELHEALRKLIEEE